MYKRVIYSGMLVASYTTFTMQPWVRPVLIAGAVTAVSSSIIPAAESYHEKTMNAGKILKKDKFKHSYRTGLGMGLIPGLNLYMMLKSRPEDHFEYAQNPDCVIRKQVDMKYYASQKGLYTGASFYLILPLAYMALICLR